MKTVNPCGLTRAALINDLSCFGKCSLSVLMPILSSYGVETVPLPTAILSTHTGGFTGFVAQLAVTNAETEANEVYINGAQPFNTTTGSHLAQFEGEKPQPRSTTFPRYPAMNQRVPLVLCIKREAPMAFSQNQPLDMLLTIGCGTMQKTRLQTTCGKIHIWLRQRKRLHLLRTSGSHIM